MAAHYSYKPELVTDYGKDRMRFELGDTMAEGGADTCALSDEEINAVLSMYPKETDWKRAKLKLLESICRRFAYEVDTKVGPLSYGLSERAKLWKQDYEELNEEFSTMSVPKKYQRKGTYFYGGMMKNPEVGD